MALVFRQVVLGVVAGSVLTSGSAGQAPVTLLEPQELSGRDVAQGVYVRDSTAASDQMALAARMEGLGDWSKAADVYHEMLRQYGHHLVPRRTTRAGDIYQYGTVASAVGQRLSAWPREGLDVYERRFGPEAAAMLEEATGSVPADADLLATVAQTYFHTRAGAQAALRLTDLYLSEGNTTQARATAVRLLEQHPAGAEVRPQVLLRASLASHASGDAAAAEAFLQRLRNDYPGVEGRVAGTTGPLADAAGEVLREPPVGASAARASEWPGFGGDTTRTRPAAPLGTALAPYVDLDVPGEFPGANQEQGRFDLARTADTNRRNGQMTGIFPAAAEGVLYWTDNLRLYAVALESGLALPEWRATHGGSDGAFVLDFANPDRAPGRVNINPGAAGSGWTTPRGVLLAPAVSGDLVAAVLGHRDDASFDAVGRPAVAATQIVVLDRHTGRLQWSVAVRGIDIPEGHPAHDAVGDLRECRFVGSPMFAGDALWALAKTDPLHGRPFEQSFLLSFDVRTGRLRSAVYLASASTDNLQRGFRQIQAEPEPPMAYADGTVYVSTGRGALASVRAADGQVRWLNLYPREIPDPARGARGRVPQLARQTPGQPFHVSPVVVAEGHVFLRPADARDFFVYDAVDGALVARIPASALEADWSLLGVNDGIMFTYGHDSVQAVRWRDFAPDAPETDWTAWISTVGAPDSVVGRPGLTRDEVIVPTRGDLRRIDLRTGRITATFPPGGKTWNDLEPPGDAASAELAGAGNVIVLEDQLVLAGPRRIRVLADGDVIRRRLEERLAESPGDVSPLLRLAQLAFVRGNDQEALDRLQLALEGVASLPADQSASAREGVLQAALSLADASRQMTSGSRGGRAEAYFDLAEQAAQTPPQQVKIRFARAADEAGGGPARRVALLQEILSDPAWRQVQTVAAGEGDTAESASRAAGVVARAQIDAIRARHGPSSYAVVEAQARERLRQAVADADAEALAQVWAAYPNSRAAGLALVEASSASAADDRWREVAQVQREMLAYLSWRDDEAFSRFDALLRLSAAQAHFGRHASAAGLLRRLAREFPQRTLDLDDVGAQDDRLLASLTDAADRALTGLRLDHAAYALAERAAREMPALASGLNPPPDAEPYDPSPAWRLDDVRGLIRPSPGFTRHDRVLLRRTDGRVSVLATGAPAAQVVFDVDAPDATHAAWTDAGATLLLWGPSGVRSVDADDGSTRWTASPDDADPAPELPVPVAWRGVDAADRMTPERDLLERTIARMRFPRGQDEATQRALATLRAAADARRLTIDMPRGHLVLAEPEGQIRVTLLPGNRANLRHGQGAVLVELGGDPRDVPRPDADAAFPVAFVGDGTDGELLGLLADDEVQVAVVTRDGAPRLVGLDRSSGRTLWAAVPPAGEVTQAHAGPAFVAVRTDGPTRAHLSVVDRATGEPAFRQGFDRGGADSLVNFMVTDEDELIVVTERRVVGYALPAGFQNVERFVARPTDGANATPFVPAAGAGRVAVVGETLLVTADVRLTGRRDVLVVGLDTGRPRAVRDPLTRQALDVVLAAADAGDGTVAVPPPQRRGLAEPHAPPAAEGERIWTDPASPTGMFYVTGRRGVTAYDVSRSGLHWARFNNAWVRQNDPAVVRELVPADSHVVLIDTPERTDARAVRVTAFSRQRLPDGRESGLEVGHEQTFSRNTYGLRGEPVAWQVAENGLVVVDAEGNALLYRPAGGDE